ncbi:8-oxo-dGDP phosphatase NUDT18 isoform X1 [Poecilia formosa]|uniref:8-oxo-dGDP phosphatase NUDT18 isoform X1 n=1 Tax=Poecilia formosa TaxID=48698 RepID=UPI0007B9FC75|nr:PREDICTED: 8-oxo-dGDP phosphatase NUDT18 isoform X1 [Poecilia formosa]XP_016520785.1 PREDICTED: 8-oxo-dGDP phosphatase NUDT18 isoform X1 [Poecilia formosa]
MEVTAKERQQVEEQVEQLLSGQGSEVTLCDLGLELSKPATLRKNVTYIVCGVIFNEQEEVLMVQEAKPDCYKQWYLPAGRVEVGESLEEALRREVSPACHRGNGNSAFGHLILSPQVKEEAGFDCQPITLLLIQEQGPQWIRFIFLARITGGSMKTLTAADQESLQASWWDRQSSLSLRGRDILRLIDYGLRYHRSPWHGASLPLDLSCRHIVQRTLLLFVGAEKRVWILLVQAPTPHLPTAAALRTHAVTWAANMAAQEALPASYYDHDVATLGVLSLQHNGRQHGRTDGVCFNTLAALTPDRPQRDEDGLAAERPAPATPPPVENPRYVWMEVQAPALKEELLRQSQNPTLLPIQSLY